MEMLTTITKSAIITPAARGEKSEVTSDFSGVAELQDGDLLSSAKTAIDLYKGAGQYVYVHLKELRARYERGKKIKKPYLGYTNFDSLCDEKLELTSRQVRNILNGDPTGKEAKPPGGQAAQETGVGAENGTRQALLQRRHRSAGAHSGNETRKDALPALVRRRVKARSENRPQCGGGRNATEACGGNGQA